MYPFQDCGETKKETLSDDDINGDLRHLSPVAKDPGTCEPVGSGGGGCCSASDTGGLPGVLGLGVLCFVALSKKSRRRR